MMTTVVQAEGLRFSYAAAPVIDGVDLTLDAGEVFGVVGPDGAGKSTLLRLLIGQLEPAAGRASVLGRPASESSLRQYIAYMPQSFGQYLDLSVNENLEFFADLHGLDPGSGRQRIRELLGRTGLAAFADRRAGQLSGGMMQKLALACALVSQPKAMFLDEPTTGVDPVSRRSFWQLLDQVRAAGVAIVCATANMDEAERCDRIGMLVGGRFAAQGSPLELIQQVQDPLFAVHGAGARGFRHDLRTLPMTRLVFPVGDALKVWLRDAREEARFRAEVARLAPALAIERLRPTLHDVALRDLALAEGRHDGTRNGQRD